MRLGILGSGQLGCMLSNAAADLSIEAVLLDTASISKQEKIIEFVKNLTHLTFENEFIDVEMIRKVTQDHQPFLQVFPSFDSILTLQNKIFQKRLLLKLNIPTAHAFFGDLLNLEPAFDNWVLKWATFGYDGKGTLIGPKSINECQSFLREAALKNTQVFAEHKVKFSNELAIVATRSRHNEIQTYPLVVSVQKKGVCDTVYGPAHEFGISKETEIEAQEIIKQIAIELDYVGTLAVEFFYSSDIGLLVNEIAPRVHNSGHYTLMSKCSQFENHIRAITGQKLGETKSPQVFCMKNLIGVDPKKSKFCQEPGFYDYKKGDVRPGRKMGHVNFQGSGTDFKNFCLSLPSMIDI